MEQQPETKTPVDQEEVTRPLGGLPTRKSSEFIETYANNISFGTSPWDVTLFFGRIMTADPNEVYIEHRMAVTLSPQTAKVLSDFLRRNIEAYEQQYGEIRYTPIQPQGEEPSA